MLVYEAIARALHECGVESIFSVPASETMRVNVYATRLGVRHLATRHEQAAIGMADGYYRMTGKAGVVLLGRGPSLTNGVNALATAAKAKSGVLVLAGALPIELAIDPRRAGAHLLSSKSIDQEGFLASRGVATATIGGPDSAAADVALAVELVESGVTVALLLPTDVGPAQAGHKPARVDFTTVRPAEPAPADAVVVALIADVLGEGWAARRPLILAGRGAVRSGAHDALVRLAELTGSLLCTSLLGRGYFADDSFSLGIAGTMSDPTASDYIANSDLVLAFGASLNPFTTYGGDLFERAKVIQFDQDAEALGRKFPVELGVRADARLAAEQLVQELLARNHQPMPGRRNPEVADRIARARAIRPQLRDESDGSALDPRLALIALNSVLPRDRAVVADGGATTAFTGQFLDPPDPGSFVFNMDYGSMGAGYGIALGAAVARPDRITVLGIGDGGFMFSVINDLDTAVRYRLPVVIVVLDDAGFGQEHHLLAMDGLESDIANYPSVPFVDIARILGAQAIRVGKLGDIDRLADALTNLDGPLVIHIPIVRVRPDATDLIMRLGHRDSVPSELATSSDSRS